MGIAGAIVALSLWSSVTTTVIPLGVGASPPPPAAPSPAAAPLPPPPQRPPPPAASISTPSPEPGMALMGPQPPYRRWWFWAIVGAVAIGVGAIMMPSRRSAPDPYIGSLEPGVWTVP